MSFEKNNSHHESRESTEAKELGSKVKFFASAAWGALKVLTEETLEGKSNLEVGFDHAVRAKKTFDKMDPTGERAADIARTMTDAAKMIDDELNRVFDQFWQDSK